MDVFLIRAGVIENIIAVPTLAWAESAYPGYVIVERTHENAYRADGSPKNIGESFE